MPGFVKSHPQTYQKLLELFPFLAAKNRDADLETILDELTLIDVSLNRQLYAQGRAVDRVIFVVEGKVEEKHTVTLPQAAAHQMTIRHAGPGTLLALHEVLYREPHNTSGRALEDCELVALEIRQFNRLLYRFPDLRSAMAPLKIINRLRTMPLLARSDLVTISYLAEACTTKKVAKDDVIYNAGDKADTIYMIDCGQVKLESENSPLIWLGNGAEFGLGQPFAASGDNIPPLDHAAIAQCSTELLVLTRQWFVSMTGRNPEQMIGRLRRQRKRVVDELALIGEFSEDQRTQLLGFMSHDVIPNTYVMVQQHEPVNTLLVLMHGFNGALHAVDNKNQPLPSTNIRGLTYFNEAALLGRAVADSSIEAEANSQWMRLHKDDFSVFLSQPGNHRLEGTLARGPQKAADETKKDVKPKWDWLQPGERVRLEVRRHWLALLRTMSPAMVLAVIDAALMVMFWSDGLSLDLLDLGPVALTTLIFLFMLWWGVTDYTNDFLLITDLRLVHQEEIKWFSHRQHVMLLEKIENASVEAGFWGRIFNYGNIKVQSASRSESIRFDRVDSPTDVKAAIERAREERKQQYGSTGKRTIFTALENRLGMAIELRPRVLPPGPPPFAPTMRNLVAWWHHLRRGRYQLRYENERIRWHKHWAILFSKVFFPLLIALGGLFAMPIVWWIQPAGELSIGVLATITIFSVIAAATCLWIVEDWRNDVYVIDRSQVYDIEETPFLFKRQEKSAGLGQVLDITTNLPSPIHHILNFGDVLLNTAGTDGQFTFYNVPDPQGVAEVIQRRIDDFRHQDEQRAARQRAQELPEWFDAYHRLDSEADLDSENESQSDARSPRR